MDEDQDVLVRGRAQQRFSGLFDWEQVAGGVALLCLFGLVALVAQAFVWLRHGVWPPASPLALWHYVTIGVDVLGSDGSWIPREGWEAAYRARVTDGIGWIGVARVVLWVLAQHVLALALGLGLLAVYVATRGEDTKRR